MQGVSRPRPSPRDRPARGARIASTSGASALWRRLDVPGHDACRLQRTDVGWRIDGAAAFRHDGLPACLAYHLVCDDAWRTQRAEVLGWIGGRDVDFIIARGDDGVWMLNGAIVPRLDAYVDLDLSFTPATNLPQLRRTALAQGQAADVPVAWLDAATFTLEGLPQRYERRSERTYWYEAPTVGYAGLLEVDTHGFIVRYPGLWEIES